MITMEKAIRLAQGDTLTRNEIRGEEEKIIECLKRIKSNCTIVIKQLEEVQ